MLEVFHFLFGGKPTECSFFCRSTKVKVNVYDGIRYTQRQDSKVLREYSSRKGKVHERENDTFKEPYKEDKWETSVTELPCQRLGKVPQANRVFSLFKHDMRQVWKFLLYGERVETRRLRQDSVLVSFTGP